jgi:hypothetical protein
MKIAKQFLIWSGLFLFCADIAVAQRTSIMLVNATSDNTPIMATIGRQNVGPLTEGQSSTTLFGYFSRWGDIPILIHPCANTQTAYRPNWPPDWATDTGNFPGSALTHEYLVQHPSEKDIKSHIEGIGHVLKGYPGAKPKEAELKEWFKLISKAGITTEVTNCTELGPLPAVSLNWATWNAYDCDKVTIITVVGNRQSGFSIQNPPRWVQ